MEVIMASHYRDDGGLDSECSSKVRFWICFEGQTTEFADQLEVRCKRKDDNDNLMVCNLTN